MAEYKKREETEDASEFNHEEHDIASTLEEEIRAGEWQRLNQFDTYNKRSRQGKIIAMIDALSNRIVQLERMFYPFVRNHPEKAAKLLAEIKKLRVFKEYLLQCLIWEERGEFEAHDIPVELEGLI